MVQRGKVILYKDGDLWCAILERFIDLQNSLVGFGDTQQEALKSLCAELDKNYKWEIIK